MARDRRSHVGRRPVAEHGGGFGQVRLKVVGGVKGHGGVGRTRRYRLVADGRRVSSTGRADALLLLSSVAEPDADDLAVQPQRGRQARDLVGARFALTPERRLQCFPQSGVDARPLLPLPTLAERIRGRVVVGLRRRRVRTALGAVQPSRQQRPQLPHVPGAQLLRLEPTDGRLREHAAVERAERQADVGLSEPELDPVLLELPSKLFHVVGGGARRRRKRKLSSPVVEFGVV